MSEQIQVHRFDVVVVGAGPAGAHAAGSMARAGLEVALVDRKAKGLAGAQWLNGVAPWMMDKAGVPRPASTKGKERGPIFSMAVPGAERRVRIVDNPVLDVDMRELGTELADAFEAAPSAHPFWEHDVTGVNSRDGRIESLVIRNRENQARTRLEARLFIDASGLGAVLRHACPALDKKCTAVKPSNICVAAQAVYEIDDIHGARQFLGRHRIESGEVLGMVGLEGGFSLLRPEVDLNHRRFSILTGSIANRAYRSGKRILDDFVAEEPWIGERIFGGHGPIPLRRPYAHLVAPGLALLGDSAGQVFSSHGSGIGIGLIAARILADVVGTVYGAGGDIGALESLWSYPKRFHREYGGLLCTSDVLRRFSQSLTLEDTQSLFDHGILTVGMARSGLGQFTPELDLSETLDQVRGLMKTLPLAARMVRVLGRLPAISALNSRYPGRPAQARVTVGAWDFAMKRLVESV
ncbi:MAG: FAD-dependent oxidoreductase [Deltaproteobacteria bacterium]|nr:FAD-dependent oxidoreductase [Deltaproteobacteria bacterium]